MKLKDNEFTTESLLEYLRDNYKKKVNNQPFTKSDIAQYLRRGYLPYRYGGNKLKIERTEGIRTILLSK